MHESNRLDSARAEPAGRPTCSVASNLTVTAMPTLGLFSMDGFSGSCSMVPEFSYGGKKYPRLWWIVMTCNGDITP